MSIKKRIFARIICHAKTVAMLSVFELMTISQTHISNNKTTYNGK